MKKQSSLKEVIEKGLNPLRIIIPHSTLHTRFCVRGRRTVVARLAVDPIAPLQGDRAARLDEPSVLGEQHPPRPLRRWEIPAFAGMTSWGRGTPNSGLNLLCG